jgi:DNA-binding CsgD family transcriptional regulator
VKVALDVSPLRLTRAGSARYVLGLRETLRGRVELEEFAWGGGGRATAALRDALWYPLALPRAARGADVLHCPTFRAPPRPRVPLAPAQREVLALLLSGLSNAVIARRRGRATRTVANQVAAIFRRLGVTSRLELFALFARGDGAGGGGP